MKPKARKRLRTVRHATAQRFQRQLQGRQQRFAWFAVGLALFCRKA